MTRSEILTEYYKILECRINILEGRIKILEEKIWELAIVDKNKRRINMISKNDLDKRICDLEGGSNEQTYREYIRETEEEFGMGKKDIEKLTQTEFNNYIDLLNWLWEE